MSEKTEITFMQTRLGGAILLSMITGFACTISAIEKNKKD